MSSFVNLLDVVYPVGSVYCSMNSTSPATLFGGTWKQVTSRFLYGSTSGEATGGSSSHYHKWYLNWIEWQGTLASMNNNQSGDQLESGTDIYGGDGESGDMTLSKTYGTSPWGHTKAADVSGYTTARNPKTVHIECKTTDESTLPPYITCYMWYRTA